MADSPSERAKKQREAPRFVYVSTVRAGSRSIRVCLFGEDATAKDAPCFWMVPASEIRARFLERGWDWDRTFKFAVVRNPWDRLVSAFHFWRMDGGRRELPRLGRMSALRRDFRAWLETHRARLSPDDTLFAQWPCLSGERGEILVDFVARFERLHEDWDVICRHIGVEVSLPHRHKTCHLHYSAYYDRETADLVRSLCERDVDLFRYSFEGLSPVDAALDWSRFARDCALAALPSGTRLKALRRRLGRGAGRS